MTGNRDLIGLTFLSVINNGLELYHSKHLVSKAP